MEVGSVVEYWPADQWGDGDQEKPTKIGTVAGIIPAVDSPSGMRLEGEKLIVKDSTGEIEQVNYSQVVERMRVLYERKSPRHNWRVAYSARLSDSKDLQRQMMLAEQYRETAPKSPGWSEYEQGFKVIVETSDLNSYDNLPRTERLEGV